MKTNALRTTALIATMAAIDVYADLWVSPVGSDSNPGTEAAPLLSIQAAVDAAPAEGCTIHVAEGYHYVKSGTSPDQLLTINKPVRIIATGDRSQTFIDAENKRRNTWMNCEGALLSGFTIRRGKHSAWNSFGGVRVTAGIVSNCVIEANESYHYDGAFVDGGTLIDCVVRNNKTGTNVNGQGVRISKGLVANCEIYGQNTKTEAASAAGAGVYAEGGVVSNCYIHGNCLGSAGYTNSRGEPTVGNSGAGVRVLGSARVTRCIISDNGITGSGGGVYISAGVLDNCLIYGNATTNLYGSAGGAVYVSGGVVSNCTITANSGSGLCEGMMQAGGTVRDCIVFGNGAWDYQRTGGTAEGVVTNNPGFANAIAGDWRLTSASPCAGAGSESVLTGFGCAFSHDKTVVRSGTGADVTFTATSANASGSVSYTWDFGDGTTATGATTTHHYAPGFWSVRLTATDGSGTASSSAADCVAVLPEKVYVAKTGSATSPYSSLETATPDIYAALALRPLEIEVHEGTYDVSKGPIPMLSPLRIHGVGGRENVILDAQNVNYTRIAYLGHDEARLEGVTLYRGNNYGGWSPGAGAVVKAGLVSNCWFRANTSYRGPAFFLRSPGAIVDSLISGNNCGGGDTYGEAGEMTGGLFAGNTVTAPGTINSTTGRGTLYVHGASAVVSNCVFHGNNIGGTTKSNTGGAIFLENGLVVNCVISNNTASVKGGGVNMSGGTLRNCLVADNRLNASAGSSGGGVYNTGGTIENCTILGNAAAVSGGGVYMTKGSVVNSVVYYNSQENITATGGTVSHTASMPAATGDGNTAAEPAYLDYAGHDYRYTSLATAFIDTATALPWMAGSQDLLGNGRVNGAAPDLGAIEYYPSADEPFIANFTAPVITAKLTLEAAFTAAISKYDVADCVFSWNFGDGTTLSKTGDATASHTYSTAGSYTVTLTVTPPAGATDAPAVVVRDGFIAVIPQTCYVSPMGAARFPYASWADAAQNLPEALEAGSDSVLVTNGTYSFNGVTIGRAVRVASVNGPTVTILKGSNGYNLMSLAHADAWLEGFTLRDASISDFNESSGGSGLRITAGTATNCIVRDCQKYSYGCCYVADPGRLFDSSIINNSCGANSSQGCALVVVGGYVSGCIVTNNVSSQNQGTGGGGAGLYITGGTVTNCLFAGNSMRQSNSCAGGANIGGGLVTHCVFSGNSSLSYYGGVYQRGGTLRNCLIKENRCTGTTSGNGVGGLMLSGGVAESLTIVANESTLSGGGIRQTGGVLLNSIIYANVSPQECDISGGVRTNCLSTTILNGENCLAGDPQFTDSANGDWSITALSPAKDTGLVQSWMAGGFDLVGNARVQGDSVDIGAYEVDASAALPLTAAFAVTTTEKLANGNTRVTFEATAVGATGTLAYRWLFGDAENEDWTSYNTPVCTHEYAPGAYTVTLRAHDNGSDEDAPDVVRVDYAIALPDVCYVANGEGVTPKYPYVTPETGAPGLKEAIDVGVGEVVVCRGTYEAAETIAVGRPILIRGETGNPADAVISAPKTDGHRVMNVQNSQAIVSGITLRGGSMLFANSGTGGASLYISAGMATNCVFENGVNYYNGSVYVEGGSVIDCVIRNSSGGHSVQDATALTMTGGLVDRCVITGNVATASNDGTRGSAVTLNGATAILRNSLIARNTGHNVGGVRIAAAQEFSNCTVVTNTARGQCGGVKVDGRPAVCANNIVWGNVAQTTPDCDNSLVFMYSCCPTFTQGIGNITDNPLFRAPEEFDWSLDPTSRCIDAGLWNLVGETKDEVRTRRDLAGAPRFVRSKIDMGCYEAQNPAGTMILLR
jgi:PKD repeat protein